MKEILKSFIHLILTGLADVSILHGYSVEVKMNGDSVMKKANNSNKYLNPNEKDRRLFNNWILPALIFIVMVAVGVHTYLVTVGGY
jgi:hypothetical protein